jgi:hypothetical protein
MQTKRCNRCGEDKSTDDFHRRGKGFQPRCKACAKEIDAARSIPANGFDRVEEDEPDGATLERIAAEFSVTRARAGQMVKAALAKARKNAWRFF